MQGRQSRQISPALAFSESDVRHLCGVTAYRQGDAWQRAGHVEKPGRSYEGLTAEVRGTWRRVDIPEVFGAGGHVQSSCTCTSGPFCRHVAALMLHWLRDPASFVGELEELDPDVDLPGVEAETAANQIETALMADTMNHLRVIARRRGLKITAKNKQELVRQLAPALAQPESIDVALEDLSQEERDILDLLDLLLSAGKGREHELEVGWRAWKGETYPFPIQEELPEPLLDRGLVFHRDDPARGVYESYEIPLAVSSRLPDWALIPPLDRVPSSDHGRKAGLGLMDLFLILSHQIRAGGVGQTLRNLEAGDMTRTIPGWRVDLEAHTAPAGRQTSRRESLLAPMPSPLMARELTNLVELTGRSPSMIDFALLLMRMLGLVTVEEAQQGERLTVDDRLLDIFLQLGPRERREVLTNAWFTAAGASDLRPMLGSNKPLQFAYNQSMMSNWRYDQPRIAVARAFISHLLGRLPPGWYSVQALLDLVWTLSPNVLVSHPSGRSSWSFKRGKKSLNLKEREDWQVVWGHLVQSFLTGPLTWLGYAETAGPSGSVEHFQVLPAAALLAGRVTPEMWDTWDGAAAVLAVTMDRGEGVPAVTVVSGGEDEYWHTLLGWIGQLAWVSPEGLCYHLTRERLRAAFDSGLDGTDLLKELSKGAGGDLPEAVQQKIEEWWSSFGTVRIYDDLTLVELGDDLLWRELEATSSLGTIAVRVFSPRLIAVDPTQLESLLAELTRLGHTPRVSEEA